MKIKSPPILAVSLFLIASSPWVPAAEIEEVARFPQQLTGIGVSPASGRIFINFPYWSKAHTLSVAEVKDGKPVAFPDEKWNQKEGEASKRFVCVQSVVVDDQDMLWILDAGSPMQEGVIAGGAKLIKVDLKSNEVVKTYPMEDEVAPEKSYLNDIRIDTKNGYAFITESSIGSIIVVNLESGKPRRVLANHPSTKVEVGTEIMVDGIKPIDPKTNGVPQFHADGIALDAKGWLYFHALTGSTLYRIKTSDLMDPKLSDKELEEKVVKVAKTVSPDGMLEDKQGRVYLASFEKNSIVRFDPETEKSTTVIEDKRLQWPDTMSWGPDDQLYVTTSQIHRTPKYNNGVSKLEEPFKVFRIKIEK